MKHFYNNKKINSFNANLLHEHFSICFTWNTIFPFSLQPDCFMWNIHFKKNFTTKEPCFVLHETIPKGSSTYSFVCKPDKSYFLSVFPLKQRFMWNINSNSSKNYRVQKLPKWEPGVFSYFIIISKDSFTWNQLLIDSYPQCA